MTLTILVFIWTVAGILGAVCFDVARVRWHYRIYRTPPAFDWFWVLLGITLIFAGPISLLLALGMLASRG